MALYDYEGDDLDDDKEAKLNRPKINSGLLFSGINPQKSSDNVNPITTPINSSSDNVNPITTPINSSFEAQKAEPKGQNFLEKFFVGNSPQESQADKYGLTKPEAPQVSGFSKLLSVILPAIYASKRGVGAFPGALIGLNSLGTNAQDQYKQQLGDYQKDKSLAQADEYKSLSLAQQAAHNSATEKMAQATLDANSQNRKDDLDLKRDELGIKKGMLGVAQQTAETSSNQTPTLKLMSADKAKTLEVAKSGIRNIDLLTEKINSGSKLIMPSVFDRDTAAIQKDLADLIGRIRSGGAINKYELATYESLIPGALDSQKTKLNKLARMKTMFEGLQDNMTGTTSSTSSNSVNSTIKAPANLTPDQARALLKQKGLIQ